jgi:hypothetical protein
MKRGCAVLALGLGLLAASVSWAGEGDVPLTVAQPVAAPPNGNGNGSGSCGASCHSCAASCWERLCDFFTYRGSRSPCCNTCRSFCSGCYCYPPPYAYFLGDYCREGRTYATCHRCGGGCGPQGCGHPPAAPLAGPTTPPGLGPQAAPPAGHPMPAHP